MHRTGYAVGVNADNTLAQDFRDSGAGGLPVARPHLGGLHSGFHTVPNIGDEFVMHYEQDGFPSGVTSSASQPQLMTPLLPGESAVFHLNGRVASNLLNSGVSTLFSDAAGNLAQFSAGGALALTAQGGLALNGNTALTGTLGVSGATTLSSFLTVVGGTNLQGGLTVLGNIGATGAIIASGDLDAVGNLNVLGNAVLNKTLLVGSDITALGAVNGFTALNAGGASPFVVDSVGNTTVASLTLASGDLVLNSQGSATATLGGAAGSGGSPSATILRGGSRGGVITLTTGSGGATIGDLVTVVMAQPQKDTNYQVFLEGMSVTVNTILAMGIGNLSTSSFTITVSAAPLLNTNYRISYLIVR